MQKHNWNTVGLFLIALAVQMGGLHSWREITSIPFVTGSLMSFGVLLKGMYEPGPGDK
jgi:hypothetical protein